MTNVSVPISLILLPGMDGTGVMFQPLLKVLPTWIKATAVQYPGDRVLSYDDLARLVTDVLPRGEPFILLGESFSGPIAVKVASQHPPGLIGLILCATFVTPPWRRVGPLIPLLARPLPFSLYLPFKRLRSQSDLFAQVAKLVRPSVIAARVRMTFNIDELDALRACSVPILDLRGTKDRVVPVRHLQNLREIQPSLQTVTIGRSHMVLQKHPQEAAAAIAQFTSNLINAQLPQAGV